MLTWTKRVTGAVICCIMAGACVYVETAPRGPSDLEGGAPVEFFEEVSEVRVVRFYPPGRATRVWRDVVQWNDSGGVLRFRTRNGDEVTISGAWKMSWEVEDD